QSAIDLSGFNDDLDYDNYGSWNLKTNGVQRTTIQSGGDLNLIAGTGIANSYSAGGGVTHSFDVGWGDGRYLNHDTSIITAGSLNDLLNNRAKIETFNTGVTDRPTPAGGVLISSGNDGGVSQDAF